jgi:TatD family-associated radical SAM protein
LAYTYEVGDGLYLNITNACTCDCDFCVRRAQDAVGNADTLWLDREPSAEEVLAELETRDLSRYREAVFCGYGEPTLRLGTLLAVARGIKARRPEMPVRVNTNGHGSLAAGRDIIPELRGLADALSISLNYPDAASYAEHCRPNLGERAYAAVLDFAAQAARHIPDVTLTVVDVLTPEQAEACRRAAEGLGAKFRVRPQLTVNNEQ